MDSKGKDHHSSIWLKLIDEVKVKYEVWPIDAQLDRDWVLIPGYNGFHINRGETLKQLERAGTWDETQLVLEEIEPAVSLSDLEPAPIYQGNANKPMISFMINVAWGNEYLSELLGTLKRYEVKATFFLDGSWVSRFPSLAKDIGNAGHEVGNHAYSHPDMRSLPVENIIWELRRTNEVILKEIGVVPDLFTPPSGSYDKRVVKLSNQEGMYTILSTIDTVDWKKPHPVEIINKVKSNLKNGSIILMHPTESSLKALPAMLDTIIETGYTIGTISDLLSTKRVHTNS